MDPLLLSSYSYPAPTLIQLLLLLTRACETHGCTAEPPHPFTGISGHALRRHRLHRRRLSAPQFLICNEHGPAMLRGLRALRLEAHWSLVELVPLAAPRSATSLPLAERESPMHMYSMHSHVAVRCCDSAHAMRMASISRCKHEHAPREAQGAPRDAAGTRLALHGVRPCRILGDEHVRLVCYTAGTLSQHKVSLACHTRLLLRRTA